jgi:hypothetical protein
MVLKQLEYLRTIPESVIGAFNDIDLVCRNLELFEDRYMVSFSKTYTEICNWSDLIMSSFREDDARAKNYSDEAFRIFKITGKLMGRNITNVDDINRLLGGNSFLLNVENFDLDGFDIGTGDDFNIFGIGDEVCETNFLDLKAAPNVNDFQANVMEWTIKVMKYFEYRFYYKRDSDIQHASLNHKKLHYQSLWREQSDETLMNVSKKFTSLFKRLPQEKKDTKVTDDSVKETKDVNDTSYVHIPSKKYDSFSKVINAIVLAADKQRKSPIPEGSFETKIDKFKSQYKYLVSEELKGSDKKTIADTHSAVDFLMTMLIS